jgi:thiamine transport system permease protein
VILKSPLFLHAFTFTVGQAFLSAFFAVLVGLAGAPGYARLGKVKKYLRWILLTPTLMSPILVILSLLLSFEKFPFGIKGIILGHVFLNSGLATVWLGESWESLEIKWLPIHILSGEGLLHFLKKVMLPLMAPAILSNFVVIFSFCTSSFAIPLVLGGGPQNSTLEVLIYERLRTDGDFQSATIIALVQMIFQILLFAITLKASSKIRSSQEPHLIKTPPLSLFTIPTLIITVFSVLPFLKITQNSFSKLLTLKALIPFDHYKETLFNSLCVAIGVGIIAFALLSFFLTLRKRSWLARIPTLSGVVVGLGALLVLSRMAWSGQWAFILILIIGHTVIVLPPVLRLCFPKLNAIAGEYGPPAYQMGATGFFAFRRIFIRMGSKTIILGALLAFIWSLGEFSVSRIVAGEFQTLPLLIESLLSTYRLELASVASIALLCGTLIILFFVEVVTDGVG